MPAVPGGGASSPAIGTPGTATFLPVEGNHSGTSSEQAPIGLGIEPKAVTGAGHPGRVTSGTLNTAPARVAICAAYEFA